MKKIRVRLKDRSYDILVGNGLLNKAGAILKKLDIGRDAFVITNGKLLQLYRNPLERSLKKEGFSVHFETVPDSETSKSSGMTLRLLDRISNYDKHKDIFIIAFGGGVIGDLAGFLAAVYKRGIPYLQIPTTLLAQVDSAIGGKTAIDLPTAKNLVGAFYQPRLVISDMALLKSLSARQVRSGLAEVIKCGVIEDSALFAFLERNMKKLLRRDEKALEYVVSRCAKIKAGVVERDEFDKKGVRIKLNFGHTIGHGIEAASSYCGQYNHGEAIAVGMIAATHIAMKLALIGLKDAIRIERIIKSAGLPDKVKGIEALKIYQSSLHDKKCIRGKNRLVLPTAIGTVRVANSVPEHIIKAAISERVTAK